MYPLLITVSDDQSRVTLTPIEGYEHDYINGNFVDVRDITLDTLTTC